MRLLEKPLISIVAGLLLMTGQAARAQGGDPDPAFNQAGLAPDSYVNSLAEQKDGKILLAGNFNNIGTTPAHYLARLNPDGTLDASFQPGSGPDQPPNILSLQPDGKILISGSFSQVGSLARAKLARLNADGGPDSTFDAAVNIGGNEIKTIKSQSDGKILIGGDFHSFGVSPVRNLVRLNSNGTVDSSFSGLTSVNGQVHTIIIRNDGKIWVAGQFTAINGVSRKYLARLNSNGSLDATFNPDSGSIGEAASIVARSDGKLVVSGNHFGSTEETTRRGLYCLNADGTLDLSFAPGNVPYSGATRLELDGMGRLILGGGFFETVGGLSRTNIARLDANGKVDPLFDAGKSVIANSRILVLSNGGIVVTSFKNPILRLMDSGDLPPGGPAPVVTAQSDGKGIRLIWSDIIREEGYKVERSADGVANWTEIKVLHGERTKRLYDGGLASGQKYFYRVTAFNRFGNGPASAATAFTTRTTVWPGQVDLSLDPSLSGQVEIAGNSVTQPDGKIIFMGRWKTDEYDGIWRIARINPDGSLDRFFDAGYSSNITLLLQPDGKLVVGGRFKINNGTVDTHIARFLPNGSLDSGFNASVYGTYGNVTSMLCQPDGKLVIAGVFESVNAVPRQNLARLKYDGSLDPTLDPGNTFNGNIRAIASDSKSRLLVGGNFHTPGKTTTGVARLTPSGALDPNFSAIPGLNGEVGCLAVLPDDKVLISGSFSSYNSVPSNGMARINEDGSRDATFTSPLGMGIVSISAIHLQPDGRAIIAGYFDTISNLPRRSLARLLQNGSADPSFSLIENANLSALNPHMGDRIIATGNVSFGGADIQTGLVSIFTTGGPPPPSKPLGLQAVSVSSTRIRLNWIDLPDETGYMIERARDLSGPWIPAGQSPADSPTFEDSELDPATQYYYQVRAVNSSGDSNPSEQTYAYTMWLPLTPADFQVRFYGDTQAMLTWTNSGLTNQFVIERKTTDSSSWTTVATLSEYASSHMDTGLTPGTGYDYRIRALNSGGDSVATTGLAVTTGPAGLAPAGSLDPTFTTGSGFISLQNGDPLWGPKCILLPNGKIIIHGNFTGYQGTPRADIARLNEDGTMDPSFDSGSLNSDNIWLAALQPDGKIVVAGNFRRSDGYTYPEIHRLNANGSRDSGFDSSATIDAVRQTIFSNGIQSLAIQPDGRILTGGTTLIRINGDGSRDNSFNLQIAANGFTPWISSVVPISGGRIMISGLFSTINSTIRRDLARLNADGSLDTTFDAGFTYSEGNRFSSSLKLIIQPDGKILRPGPPGTSIGLRRFLANGSQDPGFSPPSIDYGGTVYDMVLQGDGKIVIGGSFTRVANTRRENLARLNADGSIDPTFDPGLGIPGGVGGVNLQTDGNILINGGFTALGNPPRERIARILGKSVTWDSLQSWKILYGLSPHAADSSDLDNDGMSGLVEYALGGNPFIADAGLLPRSSVSSQEFLLTYTKVRTDVSYLVESSDNLKDWTAVGIDQGGSGPIVTGSMARDSNSNKFLRLKISRP